jgi:hypothetical protein
MIVYRVPSRLSSKRLFSFDGLTPHIQSIRDLVLYIRSCSLLRFRDLRRSERCQTSKTKQTGQYYCHPYRGQHGDPTPKVPVICQISRQLDVSTMLTPVFNHLLCFNFVCCAKKVRKLINRPVVSLLGNRLDGTSTEMITQCIYLKFMMNQ